MPDDSIRTLHYLPENLIIAGTLEVHCSRMNHPLPLVALQTQAAGGLTTGIYNYVFTRVTNGVQSSPSEPTATVPIFTTGSVVLSNLPIGVNRIYRSSADGSGPYTLVASFSGSNPSTFIDNGNNLGSLLREFGSIYCSIDARLAFPGRH